MPKGNKAKSKGKIVVLKKLPVGLENFTHWFKGTLRLVWNHGRYRIKVEYGLLGETADYLCSGHGYQTKPGADA